ncbi:TetR family transcriptional regulator [Streptomyces sp. RS10V-4]|uniref:TetR/AcrR family transcriptional regulator n=1 Tax=Streptomyces rhizoryzae TaxID=2932493 RepID=UPI00200492D9|nr:TetR/AcrR family transcriptional regulator [Streptomyces rhizoryzae]MCK7626373.1 TetR family transcriptional regulator [Streptomyces rhizoryzae]
MTAERGAGKGPDGTKDSGGGKRQRGAGGAADTKDRLIEAATAVLKEQGYAGTSARTIAKAAGVNSALVFYHFGGVDPLLLAALDRSSAERMARHSATVAGVRTLEELADAATRIYRDDLDGGHITLFSELVAAAVAKPELREPLSERAEPWLGFIEATLDRVIGGTPLARLTPPRDLANAAITFYLGVNLFTVLDADRSRTDSVFAMARRLAPRAKLLTLRLPRRRSRGEE